MENVIDFSGIEFSPVEKVKNIRYKTIIVGRHRPLFKIRLRNFESAVISESLDVDRRKS